MRVENTLFRIAQEAMTNVAKHAQATQINVKVDWNHESLHLVIKDNGIGFDPLVSTGVNDGTGWGLLNITERAEALGGQCSVVSAPGKGTLVIVDVPL
jgi:two-component system sensor histidine kinase UhpB